MSVLNRHRATGSRGVPCPTASDEAFLTPPFPNSVSLHQFPEVTAFVALFPLMKFLFPRGRQQGRVWEKFLASPPTPTWLLLPALGLHRVGAFSFLRKHRVRLPEAEPAEEPRLLHSPEPQGLPWPASLHLAFILLFVSSYQCPVASSSRQAPICSQILGQLLVL